MTDLRYTLFDFSKCPWVPRHSATDAQVHPLFYTLAIFLPDCHNAVKGQPQPSLRPADPKMPCMSASGDQMVTTPVATTSATTCLTTGAATPVSAIAQGPNGQVQLTQAQLNQLQQRQQLLASVSGQQVVQIPPNHQLNLTAMANQAMGNATNQQQLQAIQHYQQQVAMAAAAQGGHNMNMSAAGQVHHNVGTNLGLHQAQIQQAIRQGAVTVTSAAGLTRQMDPTTQQLPPHKPRENQQLLTLACQNGFLELVQVLLAPNNSGGSDDVSADEQPENVPPPPPRAPASGEMTGQQFRLSPAGSPKANGEAQSPTRAVEKVGTVPIAQTLPESDDDATNLTSKDLLAVATNSISSMGSSIK